MVNASFIIQFLMFSTGPTLLPDGYHWVLVNRHETSEQEKFKVDEWDKNKDNPDAKLYSILSVSNFQHLKFS